MKTGLITSDTYQNHNTGPGHPEQIARVTVINENFKKINNQNIIIGNNNDNDNLRASLIGIIYQNYNLLNDFTAIENIMMPLIIRGEDKKIMWRSWRAFFLKWTKRGRTLFR